MQVIAHFDSYNKRRYSLPWVCQMTRTESMILRAVLELSPIEMGMKAI